MHNKILGTMWERKCCDILADRGYWVHFMTPDKTGQQPFDIIAVKNGKALAIDCKTSAKPIFHYSRIEESQRLAFERWELCGNGLGTIAIKYDDKLYCVDYGTLKAKDKVDLRLLVGEDIKEYL